MKFSEVVAQATAWLRREGRVSYRALKLEFDLSEEALDTLKEELVEAKRVAVDENGKVLVWTGSSLESRVQSLGSKEPEPVPTVRTLDPRPRDSRRDAAERRQLTVMFCDLVGSTALSTQLDPEDLRSVVQQYQQTCAAVIQRHAGTIAQYLGDGLLAYFGYPQAHDDDAQRAVQGGLGIIEAMETLNARLERDKSLRLAVRVGIHTGLVVVGEMGGGGRHEQLALGDTPNLAARIQGLAAPDTVLISAATHRLVQGYFTMAALGP